MRVFNVFFATLLLLCSGFSEEIELLKGWMDNVEAAQQIAKEKNSPLLIAFLGPNWCSESDTLEGEILSQQRFVDQLKGEVIFVKIDIPEDFEQRSFYGKSLKEKFHVNECPCLVLADSQTASIAKLDYLPLTCDHFARYVKQTLGDYERVSHLAKGELRQMKVDELEHLYARASRFADTTFKEALMKQGLKIDRGPYFLAEEYGNMLASGTGSERKLKRIRNKILARDPNNKQGCLRKLALFDFEARAKSKTPEQVIKPLVSYLKQFGSKDGENAWKLEMKISQYLFTKNQIREALKHAHLSYGVAPDEVRGEIAQSIEYLQSFVQ